ncbi:MAG: hypothetical protein JWQ35_2526 [Bacteriovoracaceae bacterium]|nr:hypothetical protein [Bacteriovoracaceae bacterium]
MTSKVCILTAGKGSRMGSLGEHLNKALLPLDKRAIISQIIERFPERFDFVIGIGHKGEQVRNYLELAHPHTNFQFVNIDRFEGPGSGPGYSLLCCKEYLQNPFYFVSCDTLWENVVDFTLKEDWMGVAQVQNSEAFCNFKLESGRIIDVKDKVKVDSQQYQAFTGLCHIWHFEDFFKALEKNDAIDGEHQISNGLSALIDLYRPLAVPMTWIDTGNNESYRKAAREYEDFDFAKENEVFYQVNGRIIKFFSDERISDNRVKRAQLNPSVFPEIDGSRPQFYSYVMAPGKILYECSTPKLFERFLKWLHQNLWKEIPLGSYSMNDKAENFYFSKTNDRLKQYYKKCGVLDGASIVNGVRIPSTQSLFEKIDWKRLYQSKPVFFHGDLHFDNALYDRASDRFTLLDWRQDFAGEIRFGDLYYDLAKLKGGLLLNYDMIKRNLFSYEEQDSVIELDFVQRHRSEVYEKILDAFVIEQKLDLYKVNLLVPLIYLNMAPLHHAPFDRLLYSLGRLHLYENLKYSEV